MNEEKLPPEGPPDFDLGQAINHLWDGKKVARRQWNGPDQYLELQRPDKNSKMTLPYIYIRTQQENLVPWLASQSDLLSGDWKLVE